MFQQPPIRLVAILFASSLVGQSFGDDASSANGKWARFRGENGLGVLPECQVQLPWQDSQVTSVKLPGTGNGSPALYGDFAFLLAADSGDATRHVVAVNVAKNKVEWTKSYPSTKHTLHKFSSYASSTPCVDSERLYVAWADPENVVLKAMTHAGEEVWTRKLGRYVSQHGFGTSPILVDGKIVLLNSQDAQELPAGVEPGEDKMLAVDCKTGATVWETALPTTRVCYGVPSIRKVGDRTELICSTTAQGMFGMDMKNGSVVWSHNCFEQRVCSSSVLLGNILIGTHGSGGGKDNRLVAFDIDSRKELFRVNRAAPYVPTPVSVNGLLFLWSDSGIVTCVELSTGTSLWNNRIGGDYSGSPVVLGDKLINVSHDGVVNVLATTREFKKLGAIETGKTVRSTIAADAKNVLLRTDNELLIIR
ncbi:MAG: PQQ-binding-like beta-propeller repeat protein [Planctomycetota bacterium]|nr:PQQ-binding-like beta-propeller repeat protein [Planctomycetota bacterium]